MSEKTTSMTTLALPGLRHWRLARDEQDLLWLDLNTADATTNTLSAEVLGELARAIDSVIAERPRGLILYATKINGFAAGADIREFDTMTEPDETATRVSEVHHLFERIEKLAFPTVARVHGFCLGGGLELALACRHIVAADDPSTRLGFPEILLGIHPGFGGTVRAIRDCGASAGLELMLTGRALNARSAQRIGLIDRAVAPRHLDAAASNFALSERPRRQPKSYLRLASHALVRPLVARISRRAVAKRALEAHYPAPYGLIDLWREHGGNASAMYTAEARSIARLLQTPSSRNLVRLFKLQERLKGFGAEQKTAVRHVHVIGAGTMGGDIAAWCALRGMHVTLQDRGAEYVAPAMQRAARLFERRLRDPYARLAAKDRLVPDFNGDGLARADVIIEAIVEDLEAKRSLFSELQTKVRPDALLATNTSSIELTEIASALDEPARLVGIHFFNPVAQMRLVEIVASDVTDSRAAARAAAFTVAIDRLPLPVKSAPGFLINRVLSPYLQEAMVLLEEGVAVQSIDAVAKQFGMPMGPLELADTVGLDICLHVGENLSAAFGGEVPMILRQKVAQKRLGRKTNGGFYAYKAGKLITPKADGRGMAPSDIRDRMLLRMLNEAIACLREGVVSDADLIDVGMVFGTGFAPFRGGPLNYARDRGAAEILDCMQRLESLHGPRFSADAGWSDL